MSDDLGQPETTSTGGQSVDLSKYVPVERFNGLNGKVQQLVEELRDWKAKYAQLSGDKDTELATLKADMKKLEADKSQFETQVAELSAAREALTTERASLESNLSIAKLVMSPDYAALAPFLVNGTLRTDGLEGEALTEYLNKFKADLESFGAQSKQRQSEGSSPPAPQGGGAPATQSTEELYNTLMSMPTSDKAYESTLAAYTKALEK